MSSSEERCARTKGERMAAEQEEIIDAIPVIEEQHPQVQVGSVELVQRGAVTHEVLKPLDVADQKEAMSIYQQGLREILDTSDWQDAGRGQKFVKKSGWRKIAAWFNLSIELIADEVERDEQGEVCRSKVWARAVAPNGRFADGDGYCDAAESRFSGPRGNKSKIENDLRGTATTRAVNRAISNLVGMGAVSAEEMDTPEQQGPPFGDPASAELTEKMQQALTYLIDNESRAIEVIAKLVEDAGGYLPRISARAIVHAAVARKQQLEAEASPATESEVMGDPAND
jgi:hypothetical protein